MTTFFGKTFRNTFILIALAEALSFAGFLVPTVNKTAFSAIIAITLYLTLKRLEYGVFIVLAEVFIASKGYLFYFAQDGQSVSLRIGLWLVVMSVWMGQTIVRWMRNKKADFPVIRSEFFHYFAFVFIFIVWGAVSGWLNHNSIGNIFFDLNGWLYFTLLFPVYEIFAVAGSENKKEQLTSSVMEILSASVVWLSFKTFFLLYIFSHGLVDASGTLYRWVRTSGVGEITSMSGGFFRVFIQSQIYILIFYFILLFRSAKESFDNKKFIIYTSLGSLTLGVIIASLSRSYWVGLVVGIFLYGAFMIREKYPARNMLSGILSIFSSFIIGIFLVILVAKFPLPAPIGGFDFSSLFANRATETTTEAGVSSRIALLPKLIEKIKQAPVLGSGFGTTVTYRTSDPRAVKSNVNGEYTTYAFEWGWLDVWVKLGFFGVISYLLLIGKIILSGMRKKISEGNNTVNISLAVGIIIVCAVSFFSPYTNHPLGIGFLIIASAVISKNKK